MRCQSPVHRKLVMTSYWVMEGGGLKLESIGKPSQAAARAWQLALGRRNAEAGQWIDWLIEELQARDNRGLSSSLLQDAWSQPGGRTGEGLTLAAALTWFVFTDVTKDAPQAAVDALKNARSRLSGALKRRADEALATVYESRGDYASAVRTLEPLAASENEPRLWRRLASLEYNAGQYAKAMARTLAALKSDPGNADWRQIKALVEMRSGKYDASIETLKKLAADKGDAVDIRNNLAWAQLMAGHLSEDLERDVLQLTSDKNASEYALHTGAMVLLERGRLTEASEANARRHRALDNDKDEASWLFRARLLQFLGYEAASRIAYAKVVKDPEPGGFQEARLGEGGRAPVGARGPPPQDAGPASFLTGAMAAGSVDPMTQSRRSHRVTRERPVQRGVVWSVLLLAAVAGCSDSTTGEPPPGCKDDSGCKSVRAPACDVATGKCVACLVEMGCQSGQVCRMAGGVLKCVEPCASPVDCLGAASGCCDNICTSLKTTSNCGTCGTACTGNQDCISGQCKCRPGYPDVCSGVCVTLDADIKNCGMCGNFCMAVTNGSPGCVNRACAVSSCNMGFADCDMMYANGCETNINTDLKNCGMCGMECMPPPNADPICRQGKCLGACLGDFRDCNNMVQDGCEVNIKTDAQHCGQCNNGECKIGQTCVDGNCV